MSEGTRIAYASCTESTIWLNRNDATPDLTMMMIQSGTSCVNDCTASGQEFPSMAMWSSGFIEGEDSLVKLHISCPTPDQEVCNQGYDTCTTQFKYRPTGTSSGDPHFKTLSGATYSFHGGCEVVFLRSLLSGVEVHIRTTRIEKGTTAFSIISGVAAKIGPNIVEVNDDAVLMVNGDVILLDNATSSASTSSQHVIPSGLTLSRSTRGIKNGIVVYNLDLGRGGKSFEIRVNKKHKMLSVDVNGSFPDGEGMMGSTSSKALFGRDKVTDFTNAWNSLGEDWQVLQSEEKLFQDKDRYPQHPAGCVYDASMMQDEASSSHLRGRRLTDEEEAPPALTIEDATAACAHAVDPHKNEFCIADVLALNDLDLAMDDPFYGYN